MYRPLMLVVFLNREIGMGLNTLGTLPFPSTLVLHRIVAYLNGSPFRFSINSMKSTLCISVSVYHEHPRSSGILHAQPPI